MARFEGTKGADRIVGTSLQDEIMGHGGDDHIDAGDGDDMVFGHRGNDRMFGGAGNDYLSGGTGDDYIDGDDGHDVIDGGAGNDWLIGGRGDDFLSGGTGNDVIFGGSGNDVVSAGEGDDLVVAGTGNDYYEGGKGFDTLDFRVATDYLEVDISKGVASSTETGDDAFTGFERFLFGSSWDVVKGSSRVETIDLGDGDNTVRSLGGADTLIGGRDSDTFVYQLVDLLDADGNHLGVDIIQNYGSNDTFDISSMVKAGSFEDFNEVVRFEASSTGSTLQVNVNGTFVDVAFIEGTWFQSDLTAMIDDRGFLLG